MSKIALSRLDKPAPRYTSYPTAPYWEKLSPPSYIAALSQAQTPLSLYFHLPFCRKMCLFCGCSVILNRKPENEERYVSYLCKEIDLVASYLPAKPLATQIHFGGGTPTTLTSEELTKLFNKITTLFSVDFSKEIAIEVDPRTVAQDEGAKLKMLRQLGFNRVSFGVQDTDSHVQEAIRRRQSLHETQKTYHLARQLDFSGINIDLIYGLPYQTPATFRQTVEDILALKPDRIALFSFAKVPWLKPHQKAIREETLPTAEEKFQIYAQAREQFTKNGYIAIGMDHFALETDELALCFKEKRLKRNFQGYTVPLSIDLIGFGLTAISSLSRSYSQNHKTLKEYYASLDSGQLPTEKGILLTEEDLLRREIIQKLMCTFEVEKVRCHPCFDTYFSKEMEKLAVLEAEGLVTLTPDKILVTPLGELFVRNIAMVFDAYLSQETTQPMFSQSI